MSKTIWKFNAAPLLQGERISAPKFAEFIHAGEGIDGGVYLWAIVDEKQPMQNPLIQAFGTGHEMPDCTPWMARRHIGTAVMSSGLVWHFFQEEGADDDN